MRQFSPGLATHLAGGVTTLCTCWRVTRADGAELGFTDHDLPIAFDGLSFEPQTGLDGAQIEATSDLAVDNTEIDGVLADDRLSAEDLAAGRYNDAEVEIWRVNWQDTSQRYLLRTCLIGEVTKSGDWFRAELRGRTEAMSRRIGRVYQRQCDARLGDGRCGVDVQSATMRGAGAVVSLADEQRFVASGLAGFEAGWFTHGLLNWTSGKNAGLKAHVKAHGVSVAGASIDLWLPTGAAMGVGDNFEITAGCDRRHETCAAKFNNLINFRGFHLMPGNDFVLSYPSADDRNDGGART